jgi:EamA domain-containing membrane protein RarD
MSAVMRACALLCAAAGVVCEVTKVLAGPGVALVLGLCLGTYLWFLAAARTVLRVPRRRQR